MDREVTRKSMYGLCMGSGSGGLMRGRDRGETSKGATLPGHMGLYGEEGVHAYVLGR